MVEDDCPEPQLITHPITSGLEQRLGVRLDILVRGSNAPAEGWTYAGEERSGAGWRDPANFLITSAFVRLLGAWEQYEMDVLKALFYYRPLGLLGDEADQAVVRAEPDVVWEFPRSEGDKDVYSKPPVWTWLRKHAENNVERAKIFKNVFGISTLPEGVTNKQRDEWYEKRNCVAHGRAGVKMTLREYLDLEAGAVEAMLYVSRQCGEKLKLLV
jgi:hypothetical protein